MLTVENFTKPVQEKQVIQPPIQPPPRPQPQPVNDVEKRAAAQSLGADNRAKLERQFAANQPTPANALKQINDLPKPAASNPAAVKTYKEQRGAIADNAIKNSQPPKFQNYLNYGLNGATASHEHQEALTSYNSQISELKKVSADVQAYPDKILTPGEAVIEINNLPRPDRSDPQAIEKYNNQRAAIADSALVNDPQPPSRDDFGAVRGLFGNHEYEEALTNYSS